MGNKEFREELSKIEKAYAKMRWDDRYRMGAEHVVKRLREAIRKSEDQARALRARR